MYEYLVGAITFVSPFYVVIEVAGVGYRVQLANPFQFEVGTAQAKIYVYQSIHETESTLYGFAKANEKQLFERLLKVSGIGPKSALAILANQDHVGLVQAIQSDDIGYLTKFPGVGKKTAQQIVLDLKGKVDDLAPTAEVPLPVVPAAAEDAETPLTEALAALKALGYKPREVERIAKQLRAFQANTTDAYLSEALRLLMKG
jgi:Holliday junction DNA helicase RuvA